MNESTGAPPQEAAPQSWPMIRAMGGVGLFCALLIVTTFQLTLPIIRKNKAAVLERAVYHVLPGATTKLTFKRSEDGTFVPLQGDEPNAQKVYAGYDDANNLVGIALEASGQGFQDAIRVLYGYSPEKQAIIGLEVLESKETPGLGDKIEHDAVFAENFKALDVSLSPDGQGLAHQIVFAKHGTKTNPWQIDGITGATISSKAITALMQRSAAEMIPLLAGQLDVFRQTN